MLFKIANLRLLITNSLYTLTLLAFFSCNNNDDLPVIRRDADFSLKYKAGELFCDQKGKITIKGKDTVTLRIGELQIFSPNGIKWLSISDQSDSLTFYRENGEIEASISVDIDTVKSCYYTLNQLTHTSRSLGLVSEELIFYSPNRLPAKRLILDNGFLSYIIICDMTGREIIKCEYDSRTKILSKTNSVYFTDPLDDSDIPYDEPDPY